MLSTHCLNNGRKSIAAKVEICTFVQENLADGLGLDLD